MVIVKSETHFVEERKRFFKRYQSEFPQSKVRKNLQFKCKKIEVDFVTIYSQKFDFNTQMYNKRKFIFL
jgi:hypothetical protein